MNLNLTISISTINVNSINSSIKRQRYLLGLFFLKKIQLYATYRKQTSKGTNRLKAKDWEKVHHANANQNRIVMAILTQK